MTEKKKKEFIEFKIDRAEYNIEQMVRFLNYSDCADALDSVRHG